MSAPLTHSGMEWHSEGSCWRRSKPGPDNRGGQDKSRSVRAVGRGENSSVDNGLAHIAGAIRTSHVSAKPLRRSLFRTLLPRR